MIVRGARFEVMETGDGAVVGALKLSEPLGTGWSPAVDTGAIQVEALAPVTHFSREHLFSVLLVHHPQVFPGLNYRSECNSNS
jgi:hypothetical protein